MIKLRRMRWAGYLAIMGRGEAYTGFSWGNLTAIIPSEDPDVNGSIIIRWIFRKWNVRELTGSSWLRIGTGARHL